jgi:hypothetical protein
MTPFYLAGHLAALALPPSLHDFVTMFFVSTTNAVVSAAMCVLLAAYSLRIGYGARTAVALALLYGFGTMAWNYSQYSFAEPLFAALLLASLLALAVWQQDSAPKWQRSLVLGIMLGLCLLTEVYAALITVPVIGLYVAWRLRSRRTEMLVTALNIATLAAGALPSVAAVWAWYLLRFGGQGVPRLSGQLSLLFAPVALYGFIFSSGKSFFLYVPPALLGILGWRAFCERDRARAVLFIAIAVPSVLFISTYVNFWHGDAAWGPRFLFHLTFLAVLPLGELLERYWGLTTRQKLIGYGVVVVSLIIQLGGVLVNLGRYLKMVQDAGLGDPHFIPYLSPVVGHWFLAASTLRQALTGHALVIYYPTGQLTQPWLAVNLGPYGGFDLWFTNLPLYWHSSLAPLIAVVGVMALLLTAVASARVLWRGRFVPVPDVRRK